MTSTFLNKPAGPIKRAEALKSLSRDHHHGLLLCWKIRTGLCTTDHDRVKRYADYFFSEFLLPHFKMEEKHVFPLLGEESEMVQKAVADHRKLEALFLKKENVLQTLVQIETELEKHIRFEERVLFNEVQKVVSDQDLEKLVVLHKETREEKWDDRFWEKPR